MSTAIVRIDSPHTPAFSCEAHTDGDLLRLWLHNRSKHTQRAYSADVARLFEYAGKPLNHIALRDLQTFADELVLEGLSPASQRRILSSIKSLFGFAHRLGYLPFDTARPLRTQGSRDSLSQRILAEDEVQQMISAEPNPRNHLILTLLYVTGCRVSELTQLKWEHCQVRNEGGQLTLFGKGDKTRTVLIPESVWGTLISQRGNAGDHEPLLISRKGSPISTSQIGRIVRQAAERAGITKPVSPHWLRHAHASHAHEAGASIELVRSTLGHASVATTGRYLHARPTESSASYLVLNNE